VLKISLYALLMYVLLFSLYALWVRLLAFVDIGVHLCCMMLYAPCCILSQTGLCTLIAWPAVNDLDALVFRCAAVSGQALVAIDVLNGVVWYAVQV
jgi:hypothetical protein